MNIGKRKLSTNWLASLIFAFIAVGFIVYSVAEQGIQERLAPDPPLEINDPPELNSDEDLICFAISRARLDSLGEGRTFAGPWLATGSVTKFPGDDNPEREVDCAIKNSFKEGKIGVEIQFKFHSYRNEKALLSGSDIPADSLREASWFDSYAELPAGWGFGRIESPLMVEVYRSCRSGAYYSIESWLASGANGVDFAQSEREFMALVSDSFSRIDKMPFCSEKKPWYRR